MIDGNFARAGSGLYLKPKVSTRNVIVRDNAGRILYACIGVHWTGSEWSHTKATYYSAGSQGEAILQFRKHHPGVVFQIVHASPAIGFFVHDAHGDKLSAGGARREERVAR